MRAALELNDFRRDEIGLVQGTHGLVDRSQGGTGTDDDSKESDGKSLLHPECSACQKSVCDLEISEPVNEKLLSRKRLDQLNLHMQPPANHLSKVAISFERIEQKSSELDHPSCGCALNSRHDADDFRISTARILFVFTFASLIFGGIGWLVASFPKVIIGLLAYLALAICIGKILKGKFS